MYNRIALEANGEFGIALDTTTCIVPCGSDVIVDRLVERADENSGFFVKVL